MSPRRISSVASVPRAAAWCSVAVLAAASGGCADEPPTPRAERVTVQLDLARARDGLANPDIPRFELEGTWVVADSRDAVRGILGESIEFPVGARGAAEIDYAFAVETTRGVTAGSIAFELRLRRDGRDEVLVDSQALIESAAQQWHEGRVQVELGERGDARLVMRSRWIGGPDGPPAGVRPIFAAPRVLAPRTAAPATSGARPNVLVISIDTLRADHLGFHGYARATSPNLDALVARGTVFERAISTSPWTLPAYGTLFTGLEPARHRAGISARREAAFGTGRAETGGDYQALADGVTTLAGAFSSAGWETKAFVSNPFLDPASSIDRGFDSFVQYLNRAQAGVELASRWIEARGDAPWFLFLHLMDPHTPYTPPAPYDTRFSKTSLRAAPGHPHSLETLRASPPSADLQALLVDSYDGEIAYTDAQIGVLLEDLRRRGALENTIVVVHSDHGEEFWEHGGFEHGHSLFDETLHVPLAFVAPGLVAEGRRIAGRTSTVHAFATLLDLAGIAVPDGVGSSLAPFLRVVGAARTDRAPDASELQPCLSEALLSGAHEKKAWSTATEKFITDGSRSSSLYDLDRDPMERDDLAASRVERVATLREMFLARARELAEQGAVEAPATYDRDRRADLERLGYPGGEPK